MDRLFSLHLSIGAWLDVGRRQARANVPQCFAPRRVRFGRLPPLLVDPLGRGAVGQGEVASDGKRLGPLARRRLSEGGPVRVRGMVQQRPVQQITERLAMSLAEITVEMPQSQTQGQIIETSETFVPADHGAEVKQHFAEQITGHAGNSLAETTLTLMHAHVQSLASAGRSQFSEDSDCQRSVEQIIEQTLARSLAKQTSI